MAITAKVFREMREHFMAATGLEPMYVTVAPRLQIDAAPLAAEHGLMLHVDAKCPPDMVYFTVDLPR